MKQKYKHDENILFLLSKGYWLMHKVLRKRFLVNGIDVTPDQWLILLNLMNEGPLYQSQLAKMQSKDRAAIKRLIDHLASRQLVLRRKSKSDKRKKKVSLTQEGDDLVIELNEIARKTFKQSSKDLNEVELNAFKRLIQRINDKV